MEDKILTQKIVKENGWNKLETITDDMLDGYTVIGEYSFENCYRLTSVIIPNSVTSIGNYAFSGCTELKSVIIPNSVTNINYCVFSNCKNLTSITIPNSVIYIGFCAFENCYNLTSVTIPNSVTNIRNGAFSNCGFKVEKRYDEQGRLIAYKGFNADMTCRDFQYEEGMICKMNGEIELCRWGFHACLNPMDCLNYYYGEIGKNVVFHEVYLEGVSNEIRNDSKVVARKITIGREITLSEMADIASDRK